MPNNLYGIIVDVELKISDVLLDGYKPLVYADVPELDQETQYIGQKEPVYMENYIYLGIDIKNIEIDTNPNPMDLGF